MFWVLPQDIIEEQIVLTVAPRRPDVIWIETYDVAIDAKIALPVIYSEAVTDAINSRRSVALTTPERAASINRKLMAEGAESRAYVEKCLSERWNQINKVVFARKSADRGLRQ